MNQFFQDATSFVNHIDEQIKTYVTAYNKVNADWRIPHEVLTGLKKTYLEANDLEQCYSCNALFEKSFLRPTKFCSDECRCREQLETI